MTDESILIKNCLKNSRKAQKELYDKYAPMLFGLCRRYAVNEAEAEDILQDAFVKIFKSLKEFEGRSLLFTWMRRITINTAITRYHKELKHRYHGDIEDYQDTKGENDAWENNTYTRDEMLGVINRLPAGYRMIFNMYAIEGFKHKEIAEALGIDINTSKSQYSRAKSMIRRKLEELG
jgi:RNA polymerase sigma-70 factor (ECF subfamily)